MSFEEPHFTKENLEQKDRSPDEILQNLRKLQGDFFKADFNEDKNDIETSQKKLLEQLQPQADNLLEKSNKPEISNTERDVLMGQWGSIMDQLAINIPWSEMSKGNERDIQNGTLERLSSYLEISPQAKLVARDIFMLYHHGAGVDKTLTKEMYEGMFNKQQPPKEFSRQCVKAEENGKPYLEKYIGLTLGEERFSLDADYKQLIAGKKMTDDQFAYTLDAANWYRRIAYYQKLAGIEEGRETNTQKAIGLHERLAAHDPIYNRFLDKIYQEQGIEKPNQ